MKTSTRSGLRKKRSRTMSVAPRPSDADKENLSPLQQSPVGNEAEGRQQTHQMKARNLARMVKILRSQLTLERSQLKREKELSDQRLAEKEEVERLRMDQNEKWEELLVHIQEEAQSGIERLAQAVKLQDQQLKLLQSEKENWVRDRIQFIFFVEKISRISEMPPQQEGIDLLRSKALDKLTDHLENLLRKSREPSPPVEIPKVDLPSSAPPESQPDLPPPPPPAESQHETPSTIVESSTQESTSEEASIKPLRWVNCAHKFQLAATSTPISSQTRRNLSPLTVSPIPHPAAIRPKTTFASQKKPLPSSNPIKIEVTQEMELLLSTTTEATTKPSIILPLGRGQAPEAANNPTEASAAGIPIRKSSPPKPQLRKGQFTSFFNTSKVHEVQQGRSRSMHVCQCGAVFRKQQALRFHIRMMTQEWKYKCSSCGEYFFYRCTLRRHRQIHHRRK